MTFAERLKALDKAATSGPWNALLYPECRSTFIEPDINCGNGYDGEIKADDARLIVALRNAAPQLAALVEAGRALADGRRGGCLYCVNGVLMTGNTQHAPDCAWTAFTAALAALEA